MSLPPKLCHELHQLPARRAQKSDAMNKQPMTVCHADVEVDVVMKQESCCLQSERTRNSSYMFENCVIEVSRQGPNCKELVAFTTSEKRGFQPTRKIISFKPDQYSVRASSATPFPNTAIENHTQNSTMPVMPQDTSASNLSDAVQSKGKDVKESSNKTLASANDHKTPGQVMNQDLGEPASKEELKKRAAELNKE